jgi:hypothetical protein
MFVEDLPMWSYFGDVVGKVKDSKTFLFPHLHFKLGYSSRTDQIVSARVTTDVSVFDLTACQDNVSFSIVSDETDLLGQICHTCLLFRQMSRRVDISDTSEAMYILFSYSVQWVEEVMEWKDRMGRYVDNQFFPSSFDIHWFTIFNSIVSSSFLVVLIVCVLRKDFSRYMELDDEAIEQEEVSESK